PDPAGGLRRSGRRARAGPASRRLGRVRRPRGWRLLQPPDRRDARVPEGPAAVTHVVWPPVEAPAVTIRWSPWDLVAMSLAAFCLLIYSQAWVFPLMGPKATGVEGGL